MSREVENQNLHGAFITNTRSRIADLVKNPKDLEYAARIMTFLGGKPLSSRIHPDPEFLDNARMIGVVRVGDRKGIYLSMVSPGNDRVRLIHNHGYSLYDLIKLDTANVGFWKENSDPDLQVREKVYTIERVTSKGDNFPPMNEDLIIKFDSRLFPMKFHFVAPLDMGFDWFDLSHGFVWTFDQIPREIREAHRDFKKRNLAYGVGIDYLLLNTS